MFDLKLHNSMTRWTEMKQEEENDTPKTKHVYHIGIMAVVWGFPPLDCLHR